MAKKTAASIEIYLKDNLCGSFENSMLRKYVDSTEIPSYITDSLNNKKKFREYQEKALRNFLYYWENERDNSENIPTQLLFYMATGSGKTLIMAALILFLYEKGYRNFIFFVKDTQIIAKTKDSFLNAASTKYLFGDKITINEKQITINDVTDFQCVDDDAINICFTSTAALHNAVTDSSEKGLSIDDLSDKKIVLIGDEAHHSNVETKKKKTTSGGVLPLSPDELEEKNWENSINKILNNNIDNILLEFTATQDLEDLAIANKYENKIIYAYPFKDFRKDRYSKDVDTVQIDLHIEDRILLAIVFSEFKRILATTINQNIKPVILFKSKKKTDNANNFKNIKALISRLSEEDLSRLKKSAQRNTHLKFAFDFIAAKGISLGHLATIIKEDFSEDKLLIWDGNTAKDKDRIRLNTLEDYDNELRGIFAVDMLDEGWDVLNLYDIVRLYETRDSGKTTNKEAQLIGRGARYYPFRTSVEDSHDYITRRKFDDDLENPLRYLEIMHYHTLQDSKYISELRKALSASGVIEDDSIVVTERLKPEFKESRLYRKGIVFKNEQINVPINPDKNDIGEQILQSTFTVTLRTGDSTVSSMFGGNESESNSQRKQINIRLGELGPHVVREALNRFPIFTFEHLHKIFLQLKSIKEFIGSKNYLANLNVVIIGNEERLNKLSPTDKLDVGVQVLAQISKMIPKDGYRKKGSVEFKPWDFSKIFTDCTFRVPQGSATKEEGKSMNGNETAYHLDLSKEDWFAYDDNYGTDEEKQLILYIREIKDKLSEKYAEVYLVRNNKQLKLFDFESEKATEPDFVLFLRRKYADDKFDNLQIFIEPKGKHLREHDEWKGRFLTEIHAKGIIHFSTPNNRFEVWGLPLFTQEHRLEFQKAMEENFLNNNGAEPRLSSFSLSTEEYQIAAEPFEIYGYSDIASTSQINQPSSILVGYFHGKEQYDWILKNNIYNIRLGDRSGSMEKYRELFDQTRLLILYGPSKLEKPIRIFKLSNPREVNGEAMASLVYPGAKEKDTYEIFDIEEICDSEIDKDSIVKGVKEKLGRRNRKPVFLTSN